MDINQKSINYLKALSAETVSHANSGHTGSAISGSPILYALFKDHLRFNPKDPKFLNRDRFVMSAGHVSALLYSSLHLFGYNISMDDLKKFRTCGSKTPGHPEYEPELGIETTTGPLGQGIANAVGMAIGETMLASRFNTKDIPIIDGYTYCYTGDGCLMEGVAVEACSLAGTLNLNKLIFLYEDNNITIDGAKTLANNDDTAKKFEAMGWNVLLVKNGDDYASCSKAIAAAKKSNKPTIIIFKTIIGIGTSKQGTSKVHAYPLPEEELKAFKATLGIETSFEIPADVYENANLSVQKNIAYYNNWGALFNKYKEKYPDKFKELSSLWKPKKINYQKILDNLLKEPPMAGRDYSSLVLNAVGSVNTAIVGGNADLIASTKAFIKDGGIYSKENRSGRTVCFGIREHAMGSVSNGLALYLGTPVFDSTFAMFANYMLPSIRMRSMMGLPIISVLTHDSIDIGQDGPTHQPIETLPTLRAIPRYTVYRPATPAEVVAGYKLFLDNPKPTAMVLTKSKISNLPLSTIESAERGGYVIHETANNPEIIIFATGTDVSLAIEIANKLPTGARVVSMPCESIFANQEISYKNKVLLKNAKLKVAIEASNDTLWYKYVGEDGLIVGVNDYQTSGNGKEVYKNAGFDADKIANKINKLIKNV